MKNQIENLFLLVLFLLLFLFSRSFLVAEDSDTLWTKNFMGSCYVSNALFSPDDKSIYVSTTEKFYELETETGKIIREIPEIRGMARYLNNNLFFILLVK